MTEKARFRIYFISNRGSSFEPLNGAALDQQNKWCRKRTEAGEPIVTAKRIKIHGDPNFRHTIW